MFAMRVGELASSPNKRSSSSAVLGGHQRTSSSVSGMDDLGSGAAMQPPSSSSMELPPLPIRRVLEDSPEVVCVSCACLF